MIRGRLPTSYLAARIGAKHMSWMFSLRSDQHFELDGAVSAAGKARGEGTRIAKREHAYSIRQG